MIYIYRNPNDSEEFIEVSQGMNEPHVYFGADGNQWQRVFTSPAMIMGAKINPFSNKDFLQKSKNFTTIGQALDLSAEMSSMREEKLGAADPIKVKASEKFYKK